MTQTRRQSFFESCINVAVGYGVAVASQIVIFPLFGVHMKVGDNLLIGLWFTAISILRSYVLRRYFNHRHRGRRHHDTRGVEKQG